MHTVAVARTTVVVGGAVVGNAGSVVAAVEGAAVEGAAEMDVVLAALG